MQIVIEIPDEILSFVYEHGFVANKHRNAINHAMLECIELPKGHRGLVDLKEVQWAFDDAILKEAKLIGVPRATHNEITKVLQNVPTIIEADKEDEEC